VGCLAVLSKASLLQSLYLCGARQEKADETLLFRLQNVEEAWLLVEKFTAKCYDERAMLSLVRIRDNTDRDEEEEKEKKNNDSVIWRKNLRSGRMKWETVKPDRVRVECTLKGKGGSARVELCKGRVGTLAA
jgi:hypothetical protein